MLLWHTLTANFLDFFCISGLTSPVALHSWYIHCTACSAFYSKLNRHFACLCVVLDVSAHTSRNPCIGSACSRLGGTPAGSRQLWVRPTLGSAGTSGLLQYKNKCSRKIGRHHSGLSGPTSLKQGHPRAHYTGLCLDCV